MHRAPVPPPGPAVVGHRSAIRPAAPGRHAAPAVGRGAGLIVAAAMAATVLIAGPPARAQQGAAPSYRTPVTPPQPGLGPNGSGSPAAGTGGVITPPAGLDNGMTTAPATPGTAAPMPVIPPPGTRANPSAPVPK